MIPGLGIRFHFETSAIPSLSSQLPAALSSARHGPQCREQTFPKERAAGGRILQNVSQIHWRWFEVKLEFIFMHSEAHTNTKITCSKAWCGAA